MRLILVSGEDSNSQSKWLLCPDLGSVVSWCKIYMASDDEGFSVFLCVAAVRLEPLTGLIKMKKLQMKITTVTFLADV